MHLELDSHPHPHPHPDPKARHGLVPWILIVAILGIGVWLGLRGGGGDGAAAAGAGGGTSGGADDSPWIAQFHQGVALMEQYNYSDAYTKFAAVAKARPQWDAARFNTGIAALNLRETYLPIAEKELREALRLNPANLHARFTLGVLLKYAQRNREALAAFEAVVKADPEEPFALYQYGSLLADQQRYGEAEALLEKAIRLQPAFSSAIYRLSMVQRNLKKMEPFKKNLETFQKLDQSKEGIVLKENYGRGGKYYLVIRDPFPAEKVAPGKPSGSGLEGSVGEVKPREPVPIGAPAARLLRPDGTPAPPPFAIGDLSGDGILDLVLCGQKSGERTEAQVWLGKGDGASFQKGASLDADGAAAALGDLDGDGDLDLVLASEGAVTIFENQKGTLTRSAMKLPPAPPGFPVKLLLLDADADWDLDIVVVRQLASGGTVGTTLSLLNNNRDGTFEDLAGKIGIGSFPFAAKDALFADLDGDIDVDLLLFAAKGEDSTVLFNGRVFRYRAVRAADAGGLAPLLEKARCPSGLRDALLPSEGAGSRSRAFLRGPTGGPLALEGSGEDGQLRLFDFGPTPKSWIGIDLVGPATPELGIKWANRCGIGATVEARAGARSWIAQVDAPGAGGAEGPHRVWFDLGGSERVDYVRILWPDGVLQVEISLAAGKVHRIEEVSREPTSCPYVFAWDGERFRYVGDFLGVGGLGYLVAPGVYSKPDPTEVLELPPLLPRSGPGGALEYEVRLLEPLEECTYLDAAELVAVDAPAGTTIHPNELFAVNAPPPGAELLAYREAILPKRVTDHRGDDLTEALREVDRIYDEGGWIPDRRFPGAAEPHSFTMEFEEPLVAESGSSDRARPFLFLYGYVEYGYSTSNFAAAQAKVVFHAPTISVEREGKWAPLRSEWGFPGGTPRWMAVDLGGLLRPEDRKLRLETDLEVYFDQAFVARGEAIPLGEIGRRRPGETLGGKERRVTVLAPARAELAFKGFPRSYRPDASDPYLYDYERLSPSLPGMKPFPGHYTPFGSVADLVGAADDKLAVFGGGEEVALAFPHDRLPPLPEGWKRTFFLAAVGYCKDTDLYTACPDRVEPMPFRAMSNYPPPEGERGPEPRESERISRVVEPFVFGKD